MAKRLFRVTISATVYILAEDENEAEDEARELHSEETGRTIRADEATDVPDVWEDSYPFGGDGTKTCREILDAPEDESE
ncbi:MAG: hypothetical protein ABIE42_10190 [Candidatus Eisenbacteria bacterium]